MPLAVCSSAKRRASAPTRLAKGNARGTARIGRPRLGFVGIAPQLGATISPHPPALQTKLKIGEPNDRFEQEADRVADQVLRGEPVGSLSGVSEHPQRKCAACAAEEKETARRQVDGEEGELQLKPDAGRRQTAGGEAAAAAVAHGGRPLLPAERDYFEPRFGCDFADVRIHDEPRAHSAAQAINARAFTLGSNIALGTRAYIPGTQEGQRLLAHELTHVVQQSRGRPALGGRSLSSLSAASGAIQRQCREESFYRDSPEYCLDDTYSPITHSGQRCYRQIPRRDSYFSCPASEHVCFDEEGNCDESPDRSSIAESRESDGSCNFNWYCVAEHTAVDFLPAILPEGPPLGRRWPDGSVRFPDGTIVHPGGRVTLGPGPKF